MCLKAVVILLQSLQATVQNPVLAKIMADAMEKAKALARPATAAPTSTRRPGPQRVQSANVYYGPARRLALKVKARAECFVAEKRLESASTALTEHLKAMR